MFLIFKEADMKANQFRKTILVLIFFCVIILTLTTISCSKKESSESVDYDSLTPQWKSFESALVFVTARDGTKLAVDYYLPSEYLGFGVNPKKNSNI